VLRRIATSSSEDNGNRASRLPRIRFSSRTGAPGMRSWRALFERPAELRRRPSGCRDGVCRRADLWRRGLVRGGLSPWRRGASRAPVFDAQDRLTYRVDMSSAVPRLSDDGAAEPFCNREWLTQAVTLGRRTGD